MRWSPDHDGVPHAGHHPVPGTVELGEIDDPRGSGLLEAEEMFASLRTEEVDRPPLPLVVFRERGVGVAAGEHNVSQGVPAGLDRSEVLELSVRVSDGSHQGEVGRLVHPEQDIFRLYGIKGRLYVILSVHGSLMS